ncbi:MAG: T9SS type A sorting domain-containing protein, partial [Bacteroidales bacterium]|nr:T9SS type A sorting domain-containing protein [Bacteroidales bacterium]
NALSDIILDKWDNQGEYDFTYNLYTPEKQDMLDGKYAVYKVNVQSDNEEYDLPIIIGTDVFEKYNSVSGKTYYYYYLNSNVAVQMPQTSYTKLLLDGEDINTQPAETYNFIGIDSDHTFSLFYEEIPTNINQSEATTIKLSPNPASNYITIEGLKCKAIIKFINMSGTTISKQSVKNKQVVYLNHLTNGVYFAQIQQGNIGKVIKILIKK